MAKLWYRKQKLEKKKASEELVRRALSDEVVSIERTRKFSRRARLNMVGYYMLTKDAKATTPTDLKGFKMERKSHTNIADECTGWIHHFIRRLERIRK